MPGTPIAPGTVPNYLAWAIIATVLSLCLCCVIGTIPGIVAIVFAAKVNTLLGQGDLAGAQRASNTAKVWCWVTTGLCIIEMKFDAEQWPVDYMIVEGNAAFERLTGLFGADGKWVSEIAPGLEQHWFDLYGQVALTGEPARFENPADIFGRWYDVQAMRLGGPEARRVAILFNDITARKALELRQQVLLDLNDAIRDLTDPAEIAQASARILAEALKVSRVGYGVMDTDAETVTIERDYNAPGVQSIAGVIHFREFGDYIEDLARGQAVVFDDGGADHPVVLDQEHPHRPSVHPDPCRSSTRRNCFVSRNPRHKRDHISFDLAGT